jgi:hypothetical protein
VEDRESEPARGTSRQGGWARTEFAGRRIHGPWVQVAAEEAESGLAARFCHFVLVGNSEDAQQLV